MTRTVGSDRGHTDVSLWFVAPARRGRPLVLDRTEAYDARWWSPSEVRAAGPAGFDPHLGRFLAKLAAPPADRRPTVPDDGPGGGSSRHVEPVAW